MNDSNIQKEAENVGYLVVRVSTARGAIPLENAAVSIRGSTPESSGIIHSMTTDRDGLTKKISLPAPALALSGSPGNPQPFSTWNIDVFRDGYVPVRFQNVPVYSSIVSVQPAVLVPISENFTVPEVYNESEAPNL